MRAQMVNHMHALVSPKVTVAFPHSCSDGRMVSSYLLIA